ncbi:MAG: pyridoxamine 5'-phosphate oxidase family protein, partial [Gammaproteobacteria bacterium]|nr:pyridoxamine 5'-phosphate oxidase family protein [Gammaproteobacteria bacterium]
MTDFKQIAPAFLEMAHKIVWCTTATVDTKGRPRSRVLHPLWQWDGETLIGWVATGPTPTKIAHLKASPYVSCNYWGPSHDTCVAECRAELALDAETKQMVWDLFLNGPEPVGYDPAIIPTWENAESPSFAALKLDPWLLRVMPGSVMMEGQGELLTWQE